jgi:hypothetical protein
LQCVYPTRIHQPRDNWSSVLFPLYLNLMLNAPRQ